MCSWSCGELVLDANWWKPKGASHSLEWKVFWRCVSFQTIHRRYHCRNMTLMRSYNLMEACHRLHNVTLLNSRNDYHWLPVEQETMPIEANHSLFHSLRFPLICLPAVIDQYQQRCWCAWPHLISQWSDSLHRFYIGIQAVAAGSPYWTAEISVKTMI